MSSSSTTNAGAFDAHLAWLRGLYKAHAEMRKGHDASVPAPFAISTAAVAAPSAAPAAPSPLPVPPMAWAHPDEGNVEQSFSGMSLEYADEDFEAPVYRSLGGLFSTTSSFPPAEELEDEAPVYRSLDLAASMAEEEPAEAVEQSWLREMPPLIHRQRGGCL